MADMNEVVVSQDGTVESSDSEKLTTGEKLIVGATCVGIGTAGYLLGTYVIAPIIRKAKSKVAETEFERAKRESKGHKKTNRSRSGVEYDEDAEFRDAEETED